MKIFDAHCDTIEKIHRFGGNLYSNDYHLDTKRMQKYENFAQVFAAFTDVEELSPNVTPTEHTLSLIECYHNQIEQNSEHIAHCATSNDISRAFDNGKIAAMLSIEGGEALGGDLDNLRMFYNLGVRILTLTWNHKNELGSGIFGGRGGLTDFGKAVVFEMNRLKMLIDVSHLNEAGFWDVIKITKMPVIASHSNAFAQCNHPRNLTDKQIAALVDMQGCIGINLYTDFLNAPTADIDDVSRHIEHFEKLGAGGTLGLGCDLDGVDKLPAGINGVQDIAKIPLTEDIAFRNFCNFLAKNLDFC